MTNGPLTRLVQIHKAIGHPVRLRLLAMLRSGPLCVCQMIVVVNLAASTVSEHLCELRKAGLVTERKEGKWVEYRLADFPLHQGVLKAMWPMLEQDTEVQADALVVKELRRVSVDELCKVNLDLRRIARPGLATAVRKAARLRTAHGAES